MEIKSLGPLTASSPLDSERDEIAAKLRSESSFVRATPPDASSADPQQRDEVRQGLLRMADFLKKTHKDQGEKESKGRQRRQKRKPASIHQRALSTYSQVAQGENEEERKGQELSLLI
jgi:hypothetical protein